jgi:hypothetical protein
MEGVPMSKKLSVKVGDQKVKSGDTVTLVITGKVRIDEYSWSPDEKSVAIEYGDGHEFWLDDAKSDVVPLPPGLIVVKH